MHNRCTPKGKKWSGREDSNLRPLCPEPNVYAPIYEQFLGFQAGVPQGSDFGGGQIRPSPSMALRLFSEPGLLIATSSSGRFARNRSRSSVRRLPSGSTRSRRPARRDAIPPAHRLPQRHAQQDGCIDVRNHRSDCRVSSRTCTTSIVSPIVSAVARDSARARPRPACESAAPWRRAPARSVRFPFRGRARQSSRRGAPCADARSAEP